MTAEILNSGLPLESGKLTVTVKRESEKIPPLVNLHNVRDTVTKMLANYILYFDIPRDS